MSESTLEAPPSPPSGATEPRREAERTSRLPAVIRQHPWWIVGVLLVIFSYLLVRHANTRPGYDPYGWLVWGYQTLHLSLDLGGAPSWKPLPFLFTLPMALFGNHQLALWMTFATAVTLSGSIFAGRIAYRLTLPADGPIDTHARWSAVAAAVFAGLALLGIQTWVHLFLSAQSDTLIVALCLAAIDMHLSGRHRWAYAFLVLAALGRPESWPFTGLYFLWAWRAKPQMRKYLAFGLVLIPVMWFGVPTITNNRPLVSAELAELSARRIQGNKFIGVFHRYTALTCLPIQLLALLAVIWAYFRRNRTVLVLAGAAVLWMVVEMGFVLHGWPGVPRYMIESAGVQTVLAAVAVGWILVDSPKLRIGVRAGRFPRWVGIPIVALFVAALVPAALARVKDERNDLKHERFRTKQIIRLDHAIEDIGGPHKVTACGRPTTYVGFVSILAYFVHLNVGTVAYRPTFELTQHHRIVLFSQGPHGWSVYPANSAPALTATCSMLHAKVLFDATHPDGRVVRSHGRA